MKECRMRPHYATENDFPEVEALLRDCALPIEGVREHIERYIVVRDNAGLLGCVSIEQYGDIGLLRGLAVAQRARSAGLGELLISTIVAEVRQRGVESIVLHTTSASAYFARFGFAPIAISEVPRALLPLKEFPLRDAAEGTVMQTAL
jgi:amino-acid N-acetyltransferase